MFGFFRKNGESKNVGDIRAALKRHFELMEPYDFQLYNDNDNSLHKDNASIRMPAINNYTGLGAKTVAAVCKRLEAKFRSVGQPLGVKIIDSRTKTALNGNTKLVNITSNM